MRGLERHGPLLMNGMEDGPFARVIGVRGNRSVKVEYGPSAYIERTNKPMVAIPSCTIISRS